jgi:hypothetical protein
MFYDIIVLYNFKQNMVTQLLTHKLVQNIDTVSPAVVEILACLVNAHGQSVEDDEKFCVDMPYLYSDWSKMSDENKHRVAAAVSQKLGRTIEMRTVTKAIQETTRQIGMEAVGVASLQHLLES